MRDLRADLELCERATPGPWDSWDFDCSDEGDQSRTGLWVTSEHQSDSAICTFGVNPTEQDYRNARFIAAARAGWPEAIKRAMAAEQGMEELHARLVADELETLDFLWQEYVQADPATLTEDAKELAARVRQKVRELAGVEALEAERDELQTHLAEVEAEAAKMRSALEDVDAVHRSALGQANERGDNLTPLQVWERVRAALSSSAGRETVERLRRLQAVAEAAEPVYQAVERAWEQVYPALCAATEDFVELREALQALKGGDDNAGSQAR